MGWATFIWWENPCKGEDYDGFFMQNTSLIDINLFSPRHPSVLLSSARGGEIVDKASLLTVCYTKNHDRATLPYRRSEAPVSPYRCPDALIYFNTLRIQSFVPNINICYHLDSNHHQTAACLLGDHHLTN